jgi:hypothetical protein
MAKPKNLSNWFQAYPRGAKNKNGPEKERIRFQLAKTVTVEGLLKVQRSNKNNWMVGDQKFHVTSGNLWVRNNLLKFRSQRLTVKCWIRDDGVLLSVRAGGW